MSSGFAGVFGGALAKKLDAPDGFVGLMSQGTCGDSIWMNYGKPRKAVNLQQQTDAVANHAAEAWKQVQFHKSHPLGIHEQKLTLNRRTPDAEKLVRVNMEETTF